MPTNSNIILGFKTIVKKTVAVFASREFAFLYCLLGTFGQISHCYYLIESISSFEGWFRTLQAVLLSAFISSSLMYFVSIADNDNPNIKERKRIMRAVNMFMYIEILMNLYYYANHLLILNEETRIFDFIFGSLVSMLIPVTIKLYANSIKAKEWIAEFEKHTSNNVLDNEQSDDNIGSMTDVTIQNKITTSNDQIKPFFDTHIDTHPQHTENDILNKINLEISRQIQNIDVNNVMGVDNIIIKSYVKTEINKSVQEIFDNVNEQDINPENIDLYISDYVNNKINNLISSYLNNIQ